MLRQSDVGPGRIMFGSDVSGTRGPVFNFPKNIGAGHAPPLRRLITCIIRGKSILLYEIPIGIRCSTVTKIVLLKSCSMLLPLDHFQTMG